MRRSLIPLLFVSITAIGMTACKKKKQEEEDKPEFNKAAMLTNIADNIILPSYNAFYSAIETLEATYIEFQGSRTSQNLETVRNSWKNAYLSWQSVKMYNFGPAMSNGLKSAIGTFPTDTSKINNNIANGSYDLASVSNIDAIGLSSLDYLLFQPDALGDFTGSEAYTMYGLDVIQKMKEESLTVKNGWSAYRATFIASTGNESTSAFSMLVNEISKDYEEAKNAKIGIPIGKQSLGIQLPEYIETRFSGYSLPILRKSIESLKAFYNGNALSGGEGSGFDDYLIALERSSLSSTINTNFSDILSKVDSFSGTLESEMNSNVTGLDELYQLLANQVVYIKTDMTSAFGILITYQDNDGD